ncbi:MAG: FAD-dependent oxidoreductase [Actinobacteria bacterium]|uniref:Unannotated protein n=1 Tax=freshwater metagenome TaxID=449393 RepID=A0A6J7RB55_9ZZZZ|nr:FAD-dependent oxidoreductase [Actinomycetota bacterium]
MTPRETHADVVVVGGGPAGLTAARALCEAGVGSVVVLERESEAGGIPRHSHHTGYGLRDMRRVLQGPDYARRLTLAAVDAGADVRSGAMATGWADGLTLEVTSPLGRELVSARAVVLATGARERPRAARRIPGDRPAGVLTTGQLQSLVHLKGRRVGESAVIVGAELVSWSAALTLREVGCGTALMTTEHVRVDSYAAFAIPGRLALRVPLATRTRVLRVLGRERVTGVEVEALDTGARRIVNCDTVVFTGNWIPDNELARLRGVDIDPRHLGPLVDTALRTSADGVFAAGNLLHPVDTADVAALDGGHVAAQVSRFLAGNRRGASAVRLVAADPLLWVAPGLMRPGDPAPPRERLVAWASEYHRLPHVEARQDGQLLARRRLPWPLAPGRAFRIPWGLVSQARADDGDVTLSIA